MSERLMSKDSLLFLNYRRNITPRTSKFLQKWEELENHHYKSVGKLTTAKTRLKETDSESKKKPEFPKLKPDPLAEECVLSAHNIPGFRFKANGDRKKSVEDLSKDRLNATLSALTRRLLWRSTFHNLATPVSLNTTSNSVGGMQSGAFLTESGKIDEFAFRSLGQQNCPPCSPGGRNSELWSTPSMSVKQVQRQLGLKPNYNLSKEDYYRRVCMLQMTVSDPETKKLLLKITDVQTSSSITVLPSFLPGEKSEHISVPSSSLRLIENQPKGRKHCEACQNMNLINLNDLPLVKASPAGSRPLWKIAPSGTLLPPPRKNYQVLLSMSPKGDRTTETKGNSKLPCPSVNVSERRSIRKRKQSYVPDHKFLKVLDRLQNDPTPHPTLQKFNSVTKTIHQSERSASVTEDIESTSDLLRRHHSDSPFSDFVETDGKDAGCNKAQSSNRSLNISKVKQMEEVDSLNCKVQAFLNSLPDTFHKQNVDSLETTRSYSNITQEHNEESQHMDGLQENFKPKVSVRSL